MQATGIIFAARFVRPSCELLAPKTRVKEKDCRNLQESVPLITFSRGLQLCRIPVESNFAFVLVLHCYALWLAKKSHATLSTNQRLKAIVTCSDVFSRAWRRRDVFALTSDWFIGLSTSVVIGQSTNYFGFGLTSLKWKPLPKTSITKSTLRLLDIPLLYLSHLTFVSWHLVIHQRKCRTPEPGHAQA